MMKCLKESSAVHSFAKVPLSVATVAGLLGTLAAPAFADTAANTQVLQPVNVTGQNSTGRTPQNGYAGNFTSVGKGSQQQRDIPQSTTVITQEVLKDTGATSLKDALRTVSAITFNAGEGGRTGDILALRGFSATTDLFLDGVRDAGQYNRDTFNIERVDVLRGASSMLFGRGSTGGVINQVSKRAHLENERTVGLTVGTSDFYRVEADINQKLDDTSALRVNVMGQDAESFRSGATSDRWGVAPTVRFGINTPTEVELSYFYMKEKNVPDYGVPFNSFTREPLDVPVDRFYGLKNHDYEHTETHIATATIQHRFSPTASVKNTLRYAEYERDVWPTAPRISLGGASSISDKTTVNRSRPGRSGKDEVWSNQTDFSFRLFTGDIKHDVLAGLELGREKSNTLRWANVNGAVPPTTVGNPTTGDNITNATKVYSTDVNFTADTVSAYVQDMMSITPEWKVLLGARWDRFSGDYTTVNLANKTKEDTSRTDSMWNWRAGLIWQPDAQQSYYISYGTSFNPSGEAYALDPRGANTPPEKNRNYEIGAKWDLFEGDLLLRTAIFRTEKTNERNTDPLVTDVYLLSGARHTDGIELEAAGRITDKWKIFAGVALMNPKITKAAGSAKGTEGNAPANAPEYTANLWSTYEVGNGWKVGGGFNAVGRRFVNANNVNKMPSYVRWDAMVGYDAKNWDAQLNVYNLFDEKHYEGLYGGHALPGTERSAHVKVNFKF